MSDPSELDFLPSPSSNDGDDALNLATYAAMSQGGSAGVVVTPGNPDKSRLYTLTEHKEEPNAVKFPKSSIR